MHVFLTGATGFVGSAVLAELLRGGHHVTGLARSARAAAAIEAAGGEAILGDLELPESLQRGAAAADAVIHTGFIHDFSRFAEVCEIDRRAVQALGAALAGSGKRLIVTAGLAALAPGRVAVETDRAPAPTPHYPRATEAAAEAVRAQGVDISVMRLPPSVHGAGDPNFIPTLIQIARQTGRSAYIGEGLNRWSAVHRLDAARLFRLAVEAEAPLPVYHAAGEEGILFREIAAAIGRGLDLPVEPVAPAEASTQFGWFESFAAMDTAASSAMTQAHLRWSPSEPGLLHDIAAGHYFSRAEDVA